MGRVIRIDTTEIKIEIAFISKIHTEKMKKIVRFRAFEKSYLRFRHAALEIQLIQSVRLKKIVFESFTFRFSVERVGGCISRNHRKSKVFKLFWECCMCF